MPIFSKYHAPAVGGDPFAGRAIHGPPLAAEVSLLEDRIGLTKHLPHDADDPSQIDNYPNMLKRITRTRSSASSESRLMVLYSDYGVPDVLLHSS